MTTKLLVKPKAINSSHIVHTFASANKQYNLALNTGQSCSDTENITTAEWKAMAAHSLVFDYHHLATGGRKGKALLIIVAHLL